MENLCRIVKEKLFDLPPLPRSILDDIEVCIGGIESSPASENASVAEISLSKEMIMAVGRWLGNEERVKALACAPDDSSGYIEQLTEQLVRDGRFWPHSIVSCQCYVIVLQIISLNLNHSTFLCSLHFPIMQTIHLPTQYGLC